MRIGAVPAIGAEPRAARVAAREVAPARTPASRDELRAALARAHVKVTGRAASSTLLGALTAQASLETAGGAQMHNFNFGGIKGASPSGATAVCMTREVLDGRDVRLKQGFRAYATIDEGAEDYVRFMHARYGAAVAEAERGDLDGFSHALKAAHYYTAPEAEYTAALRANAGLPSQPRAGAPDGPDAFATAAAVARVLDAVAASSARIASPDDDASA